MGRGRVCEVNGFVVRVRLNDHSPPHVHVWKAGTTASFNLGDKDTLPSKRLNKSMSEKDYNKAFKIVCENHGKCWAEWRSIHGTEKDS